MLSLVDNIIYHPPAKHHQHHRRKRFRSSESKSSILSILLPSTPSSSPCPPSGKSTFPLMKREQESLWLQPRGIQRRSSSLIYPHSKVFGIVPCWRRGSRPFRTMVKATAGDAATAARYSILFILAALLIMLPKNRMDPLLFAKVLSLKGIKPGAFLLCCYYSPAHV